jgi:hypothetical protein
MYKATLKGAAIASALVSMFASGSVLAQDKADKSTSHMVKCNGSNDCKGHGGCKSAKNDCKGHNGCKGQSFTMEAGAKECAAKGGSAATAAKK